MQWEYRKVGLSVGNCRDTSGQSTDDGILELNRLGREGWEVAQVIPLTGDRGLAHSIVFLLRRQAAKHAGNAAVAGTYLGL
jgi:hypothetical protein